MAVENWKKMIEIAVDMNVPVINTEFSGDPNQQEICNGMWFRSMEELLPIIEKEGLRVEVQSHPYDFCELNNEACDLVKSFPGLQILIMSILHHMDFSMTKEKVM